MAFYYNRQIPAPALRDLAWFAAAGALFGLLAYVGIALTREHSRVAALWLPNAVMAAILLRKRSGGDFGYLAAAFLGNVTANLVVGDPLDRAAGLSVCNSLEIILVVNLVRHYCDARPDMMNLRHLMIFSAIGGIVGPIISAVVALSVLTWPSWALDFNLLISWVVADSLGMLIVAPVIMVFTDAWRDHSYSRGRSLTDWILILAAGAVIAGLPFSNSPIPAFFFAGPFVILAAFRLGGVGTALAVVLVSVVATTANATGHGMIRFLHTDLFDKLLILQGFLVAIFGMSLPVAAALEGRDRLRDELERARKQAEDADRAKSTFLANMSHEIRTPMNGVMGFTELLLASELDESQRRHVQLIADSGSAMMQLLGDILDISRIEAGEIRIAREPVDLAQTLDACVKLMTPMAEQKGILLRLLLERNLPSTIHGDGLRISQIVLNLLGNALKFTDKGSVTVSAAVLMANGTYSIELAVTDTGIGISPEHRTRIFEQFVQVRRPEMASQSGAGLGLAISNHLARLMGGEISLESEPGRGSTFWVRIPLSIPASPSRDRLQTAPLQLLENDRKAARILVAEDNGINRALLEAMLTTLGHEPQIVRDGQEAVLAATHASTPFDLVLMDLRMPEFGGIEACRAIRRAIPAQSLPIIAMTANAYKEDAQECLAAGMQEHLVKPVTMPQLDAVIRRWTGKAAVSGGLVAPAPDIALQAKYRARKAETLHRLDRLVREGRLTGAASEELAMIAHKLAGVAALFGEAGIGEDARKVVETLEAAPETGDAAAMNMLKALRNSMVGG